MYGVIDIGSNTVRLAVYEVKGNSLKEMFNKKVMAGLAGYVEDGKLSQKGMKKAASTLQEMLHLAESIGLKKVYPFATASLRNIRNGQEAISYLQDKCGVKIRVLSGKEEARLDYVGALREHPRPQGVLCDVGGGSTELVFFEKEQITFENSFPIGSLNLFRNQVKGILPTFEEVYEIRSAVSRTLTEVKIPPELQNGTLTLVGGSARAMRKILSDYAPEKVEGSVVPFALLERFLNDYLRNPSRIAREILEVVPDRIHTLIPGLIVLEVVSVKAGAKNLYVSDQGVREGYLTEILEGRM